MGIRGQKPKPTFLKLLDGNPGGRPINHDEPQPDGDLTSPPDGLSDAQRAVWLEGIADVPPGMLRRLDGSYFAIWVAAKTLHKEAAAQVAKHGAVYLTGENNSPTINPWLSIMNKQALIVMKAASELGFSPTSRSRVKVSGTAKPGNRFADLKHIDDTTD